VNPRLALNGHGNGKARDVRRGAAGSRGSGILVG
jgi:hypothetical protein